MKLIIVESPNKIKKVKKYAGRGYDVIASVGHFRVLKSEGKFNLGINVEKDFEHFYENDKNKKNVVGNIQSKAKNADEILIATDPDREGEIIGWHIYNVVKKFKKSIKRITFNAITKKEIDNALNNPREIDYDLVCAAMAREGLDKMIGFMISPEVRKNTGGSSAGRVQTPTLGIIVDRDRERKNFIAKKSYSVKFIHYENNDEIKMEVLKYEGESYEKYVRDDEKEVGNFVENLKKNREKWKKVKEVNEEGIIPPPKAFDTSEVLIEAGKKFKFTNEKTTKILNDLFSEGFITYPRTDLRKIIDVGFINDVGNYVQKKFNMGIVQREVKKTDKTAQEAHEAIRPTKLERKFEEIKESTSSEHLDVYKMILVRSIVCFMPDCVEDKLKVFYLQKEKDIILGVSSKKINFLGWKVMSGIAKGDEKEEVKLPEEFIISDRDVVEIKENITKPPEEFSEATLIKQMKKVGIGRPSTYSTITSTIKKRGYVKVEKNKLVPTKVGESVIDWLRGHLSKYLEIEFTAQMETLLDQVASGKLERVELERKFFEGLLGRINELPKVEVKKDLTGEACPKCGSNMVFRKGKYGKFEGCSNYPECKYIKPKEKRG